MIQNNHCTVCEHISVEDIPQETHIIQKNEQYEDTSFAVLLALVPAMTMTLFSLMGIV